MYGWNFIDDLNDAKISVYIFIVFCVTATLKTCALFVSLYLLILECLFKKILTGTAAGKRPLGRPRHKWEDNIRIDLIGIGIDARNWVDSAQDMDYWRALMNAAFNLLVA